jgi:hypothetical protein
VRLLGVAHRLLPRGQQVVGLLDERRDVSACTITDARREQPTPEALTPGFLFCHGLPLMTIDCRPGWPAP